MTMDRYFQDRIESDASVGFLVLAHEGASTFDVSLDVAIRALIDVVTKVCP